jgi:very-short-patch-repair endonuclease
MRAMTERARLLRETSTRSEQLLWESLRARKLSGTKWRRQHKMGQFAVDFFCAELALAIEIDGNVHDGQRDRDSERQHAIEQSGVQIVRFTASEVEHDLAAVLAKLGEQISARMG